MVSYHITRQLLRRQSSLFRCQLAKEGSYCKNFLDRTYSSMNTKKTVYVTRPDIAAIGLDILRKE